jgi:hypothetical protein
LFSRAKPAYSTQSSSDRAKNAFFAETRSKPRLDAAKSVYKNFSFNFCLFQAKSSENERWNKKTMKTRAKPCEKSKNTALKLFSLEKTRAKRISCP